MAATLRWSVGARVMSGLLEVLGGLGVFLVGMVAMTDGLRALAGDALNRALVRFTRSPLTGALTGAGVTAVVQSSSATIVATVGFVSAGLLTFPQALGVVIGSNVGTTVTGWLVVVVGFELSIGQALLPALLVGVVLRLFARGRTADIGWALAGFALVFQGIALMRAGAEPLSAGMTLDAIGADGWGGRLLLLAIGAGVTALTQSSSAGVAATLTALHAGALTLPQAAVLVIGMDVGTTSTAAIASLGGSLATRRTGLAHVVYNLFTAVGALALLEPYTALVGEGSEPTVSPPIALVGFHTLFNSLGVILVVPFTGLLARLMERIVPERDPRIEQRLDPALLADPAAAVAALWSSVRDLTEASFGVTADTLGARDTTGSLAGRLSEFASGVIATRRFADAIHTEPRRPEAHARHLAAMHALDHLDRLLDRCAQTTRAETCHEDPWLAAHAEKLRDAVTAARSALRAGAPFPDDERTRQLKSEIEAERQSYRVHTLRDAASHLQPLDVAIRRLDALRWLRRITHHVARIEYHLRAGIMPPAEEIERSAEFEP